ADACPATAARPQHGRGGGAARCAGPARGAVSPGAVVPGAAQLGTTLGAVLGASAGPGAAAPATAQPPSKGAGIARSPSACRLSQRSVAHALDHAAPGQLHFS